MTYLQSIGPNTTTPQSEPLPGQVPNSAGGHAWAIDDWGRLARFLVLGSEGGSYYATERQLTKESVAAAQRCIASDGARAVRTIVEVSEAGRAPRNDPALFALAMCAALGDTDTKRAALAALPRVARTGTHLFHFVQYAQQWRGWGRALAGGVRGWYAAQAPGDLAYQAIKYQQRDGFSHRDVLRLCHVRPDGDPARAAIYHWMVKGWPGVGEQPHPDEVLRRIWAFERAKVAASDAEVAALIREHGLPRECVPTERLRSAEVWAALLEDMPTTAMVRNLAAMTRAGLLAPMSDAAAAVCARLRDGAAIRRARLHPIAVLSALRTYASGHGARGGASWTPVPQVIDALDDAFALAFQTIAPTGKRHLLALDVSGSMSTGEVAGVPGLTPRDASAAMALITARTEPRHTVMGFSTEFTPLAISAGQRLDDAVKVVSGLPFSGTDCAIPMVWALRQRVEVDAFVVYTDSETWFGSIHPAEALRRYRDATGIPARLIVVGMVSNGFTIADPDDAGMLDVVGFDSAAPAIMADVVRGAPAA